MLEELGCAKRENGHCTDPSLPRLEEGISCGCGCIMYYVGSSIDTTGGGELDHPRELSSRRLSKAEKNYSTTKREGLDMVYVLQNFRHYFFGGVFNMYTDHSTLKYLVNKLVLGGRICRLMLFFQEYDFEVIVKPG